MEFAIENQLVVNILYMAHFIPQILINVLKKMLYFYFSVLKLCK